MEMGFEFWYTAILLVVMAVLLIKEWIEIEIVVFSVLLLLIIGNVITLDEAFQGFSNAGTLTIAFMFIIAAALNDSGVLKQLNKTIFGSREGGVPRKLLRILFPISALSAFMNNTPIVAMMIPATRSWAQQANKAASKFLIPISFAAIMGGMCTLIGTSTNLVIHGLMIEQGMEGMSFFEISIVGVPLAIFGILFLVFFGDRLLPKKKEHLVELGEHTREFVIELKVVKGYAYIGKTIEEAGLRHLKGLFLFQIERQNNIIAPARPNEMIYVGDRLFFTGVPETILELQKTQGLQLTKDSHFDLKNYNSAEIRSFECSISNGSPLVGKTVRESNFRETYESVIIAIHRHGERIEQKIGDIVLKAGDTLLLLADRNFRNKWYHSRDFALVAGATSVASKPRWQANLSIATFIGMVLLTVLEIIPLLSAAGLAVVILIASKTINASEARSIIDWRVLIIIAISLGIAVGVENSGVAGILASGLVQFCSGFGVIGVLAGVYVFTSVCNLLITRNAAAALLFPIAISAAEAMAADPRPFAITVAVAAAASFATPISSPTNLMVYGAGGYRFKDFMKIGIPLQAGAGVLALILIQFYYFQG